MNANKQANTNNQTLRAGATRVEITPPMGTQIAGDIGRRRPVEEIRDPLFAHALVLEGGGRKTCWLSLDLTIVTRAWADEIRQRAAERFGFDFGAIMVHATQTHSAPALGHSMVEGDSEYLPDELWWLRGGDDTYHPFAVQKILEAVEAANRNLQPVTIAAASGVEARVAFNRRFVMRDGQAVTHPPVADPHIRYSEGPIDPEVGVLCFRGEDDTMIAALLHYTCHPNHGYPHRYISADWPGAWCDGMRELFGSQCVPFVLNGCCGNIHYVNHLDAHGVYDHQVMGEKLTQTTRELLPRLEYSATGTLDWRSRVVPIPWRPLEPTVFQEAHDLLAAHPEPIWLNAEKTQVMWDWMYAVSLLDLEKQMRASPAFAYEIQAFRVGDYAIVSLPGEPFVEGQLRLKLASPAYPLYVAHMVNCYVGYIPTPEALTRGGYETRPGNWSKLAPQALGDIVAVGEQLLHEVFPA